MGAGVEDVLLRRWYSLHRWRCFTLWFGVVWGFTDSGLLWGAGTQGLIDSLIQGAGSQGSNTEGFTG